MLPQFSSSTGSLLERWTLASIQTYWIRICIFNKLPSLIRVCLSRWEALLLQPQSSCLSLKVTWGQQSHYRVSQDKPQVNQQCSSLYQWWNTKSWCQCSDERERGWLHKCSLQGERKKLVWRCSLGQIIPVSNPVALGSVPSITRL